VSGEWVNAVVEALQVNKERSRYYGTEINNGKEIDKGKEKKERKERGSEQAVIVIVVSYLVINIVSEACACFRRLSASAGQLVGSDAIAAIGRVGQREWGAAAGDCSG
jgi:hypothetical protein